MFFLDEGTNYFICQAGANKYTEQEQAQAWAKSDLKQHKKS